MKNITVVILTIFASQVVSETNTDVIISFSNIFTKLHQDINDIQNTAHISAHEIARLLQITAFNAEYVVTNTQKDTKETVQKQTAKILEELHLSAENPSVEKCIIKSDADVAELIIKSEGGFLVCKMYDADKYNDVNSNLNELYTKQQNEHLDLEATKKLCNSTSPDVASLRNCLNYELFVNHVDLIKELRHESFNVLQKYESVYKEIGDNLLYCSNIVKKTVFAEANNIVLKFKNCCNTAVNNTLA